MQLSPGAKGGFLLRAWNAVDIKPGIIDEGLIIDRPKVIAALKELKEGVQGELTSNFVVASLPETKTFVKLFRIEKNIISGQKKNKNKKREKKTKQEEDVFIQAIERELPKEIPLSLENILYDYQIVQESATHWEVLVGAAPRDVVLEYTEILKEAGYYPMALEIEAQAIGRALIEKPKSYQLEKKKIFGLKLDTSHFFKKKSIDTKLLHKHVDEPGKAVEKNSRKDNPVLTSEADIQTNEQIKKLVKQPVHNKLDNTLSLLVDIGATRSSIIVYHHHSIQLTRSIQLSGDELTALVATKMKLSPAKAEQAKKVCGLDPKKCKGELVPVMNGWLKLLAQDIQSTIDYYTNEKEGTTALFDNIILCGGGASLLQLPEHLEEIIGVPVKVFDPATRLKPYKDIPELPQKSLPGYATVIGLAMRSI